MKKTDKKIDTMRRLISSQIDIIKRLENENEVLVAENERLKIDNNKVEDVIEKYNKIISDLEEQKREYNLLNIEMKNLKKDTMKQMRFVSFK